MAAGTFTDIAESAGVAGVGPGQGRCLGRLRRRQYARPVYLEPGAEKRAPTKRRRGVHRRRRTARGRGAKNGAIPAGSGTLTTTDRLAHLRHTGSEVTLGSRHCPYSPGPAAAGGDASTEARVAGLPTSRRRPVLDRVWLPPMGSNFDDIDNDSFLDFYLNGQPRPYSCLMPNVLLRSGGGRRIQGRSRGPWGAERLEKAAWDLVRRLGPRWRR